MPEWRAEMRIASDISPHAGQRRLYLLNADGHPISSFSIADAGRVARVLMEALAKEQHAR